MISLTQNLPLQFRADYSEQALKARQTLRVEWETGNYPCDSLLQDIKGHKREILADVAKDAFGIPFSCSKSLAVMTTRNNPRFISRKRWDQILLSIPELLKGNPSWLCQIIDNGWTFMDIFGCHPTSPENRYDYMGLLLLLYGKTIVGASRDGIALKTGSGAMSTYRRSLQTYSDQTTLDLLPDEGG